MKTTDYTINNQIVSYSIEENGYTIYLGDKPWISQSGAYIPYPDLSYEEGCLKQIEELYNGFANAQEEIKTKEDKITEIQDNQLIIMDAIATSYEKDAELSENQLLIMDAIASLYESQTI